MMRYHGTDAISASAILSNQINVCCGRGELGKGFYVGNLAHQAAAWAYHKGRRKNCGYKVIWFDIAENEFNCLHRKYLSRQQAIDKRIELRKRQQHMIYVFGVDAVISPVVGRYILHFTQIKFEGYIGQKFINDTPKNILNL